jgi:hypothetical protein
VAVRGWAKVRNLKRNSIKAAELRKETVTSKLVIPMFGCCRHRDCVSHGWSLGFLCLFGTSEEVHFIDAES